MVVAKATDNCSSLPIVFGGPRTAEDPVTAAQSFFPAHAKFVILIHFTLLGWKDMSGVLLLSSVPSCQDSLNHKYMSDNLQKMAAYVELNCAVCLIA